MRLARSSLYPVVVSQPLVRAAFFAELTPRELHDIMRLRVDVFVVEQECPYPELDGRDTEPATEHLWVEVGGEVAACVRVLEGDGCAIIGRVATARGHRGNGYAAQLVRLALERIGGQRTEIGAQTYLEGWYSQFGFARSGEDYVEDGIPHLPMAREP